MKKNKKHAGVQQFVKIRLGPPLLPTDSKSAGECIPNLGKGKTTLPMTLTNERCLESGTNLSPRMTECGRADRQLHFYMSQGASICAKPEH